jgi:hypothetical protein
VRTFVRLGGVLVAEACCSSPEFDKGFRDGDGGDLPDKRLVPLPSLASDLLRSATRSATRARCSSRASRLPDLGVLLAEGFTCAVDLGSDPDDIGFRLAVNVALYATGNQRLSDERQVDVKIAPRRRSRRRRPARRVPPGAGQARRRLEPRTRTSSPTCSST